MDVIMSAKVITIAAQANIVKTLSAIMPVINVEKEHYAMVLLTTDHNASAQKHTSVHHLLNVDQNVMATSIAILQNQLVSMEFVKIHVRDHAESMPTVC